METKRISIDELRKSENTTLRETELDIRKALATLRLEEYTAGVARSGQIKTQKRNLARLLTAKSEKNK